jgi:TonB-linked SusC/RagA family outer membrane protein
MKLTVFFLLSLIMEVKAEGYAQKVTLNEVDAPLELVFKKITKQTGYVFFYKDELMQEARRVKVNVKEMPLEKALEACFRDQPFEYLISNKTIAVKKKEPKNYVFVMEKMVAPPPTIHVNGRVIDERTGEPLAGISVLVKGNGSTGGGTLTNKDGEFRLLFPAGGVVQISVMGYEVYEEKFTADALPVIKLVQSARMLKETVVTGIFNRKASSYTGSTITLTNEDLRKVGNANVFQALKNISPSMVLDDFDMGSNPNTLPGIQLRGTSTFPVDASAGGAGLKGNYQKSPNEPLFILDGFEATVERIFDLDINRIERVTILKDAASKAIYGAKAANGVVVIETKKTTSANAVVSYNASVDLDLPDLNSYNLANSREKLQAEVIDGMYNVNDAAASIQLQQLYNARKKLAEEGLSTDWIAKPLRDGVGQKHTLTVELGGPALSFIGDLSYRKVSGVMKGSYRQNISGNIVTSYRVHKLLFRNVMSANKNATEDSPYGTFNEYAIMNPYWRAENPDGSIPFLAETGATGIEYTNPLYNAGVKSKIATDYFNFTDNFYVEWTISPGLRAVTRVGVDIKNSGSDEFYPASHTKFGSYIYDSEEMAKRKGSYTMGSGKSSFVMGDFNLAYSRERNKHFYFANAGFNVSERKFNDVAHKVEGFASDRMENIVFGRGYGIEARPLGADGITRDMGFLGAVSYMYDNRFLSDLTVRTSASSQFGAEKRWANFWSLGLGWNLHNEQLLKPLRLEQFKLRGSVGSTGNPNFATNASLATYGYYQESFYQGFPGSYLLNMANPALQWETKFDYNAGFDAKVKALTMRFDYYESYTENLVTSITIPTSTGFDAVNENLGKVKNSGFEVFASYLVWAKGRNFFSVNGGIETNKNRIVQLSNAMKSFNAKMDQQALDKSTSKPVNKYVDGMSMNAIWAVPSLGIDPATGNEIYVTRAGKTTYEWNANDMIVAGNSRPSYQGIVGFSGEYNGIGINVTGRYLGGGQLYNQTLADKVENVDMNYNVDKRVLTGRWLKPGQQALFKRLGVYAKDTDGDNILEQFPEKTRATTRFVQNRNELTIGAVNIYYLFKERLAAKMGMQRLKLAFNMNDVATFSTIRIERGTQYPFARTLSFSLSATFK